MDFLRTLHSFVTGGFGDWASVIGIAVAFTGFLITIRNVARSKTATEQTRTAVSKLREDSIRVSLVSDCSTAISIMEQIKSLHRQKQWQLLPDKYSTLRKALISVKSSSSDLSEQQRSIIQGAVQIFQGIEDQVEKGLQIGTDKIDVARLNKVISYQVDSLQEVLIAVKDKIGR